MTADAVGDYTVMMSQSVKQMRFGLTQLSLARIGQSYLAPDLKISVLSRNPNHMLLKQRYQTSNSHFPRYSLA